MTRLGPVGRSPRSTQQAAAIDAQHAAVNLVGGAWTGMFAKSSSLLQLSLDVHGRP